ISFVASVAQFTPKTVETHDERLKLMFRVKARIPPELLRQHLDFRHIGGVADIAIPDTAFGLHRRAVFAPVGGVAEGDFKALFTA
ncbi:hypothetical protein MJM95_29105, partial [Salmonella enterica subsp. enterica serovar Anatum]|nr:hypothetical protein [Salmonella enterica subsp. enterica serovar Anatum]